LTILIFALSKLFVEPRRYEMLGRGHVGDKEKRLPNHWLPLTYVFLLGVVSVALIPHLSVLLVSLSDQWFMSILPESYTLNHYAQLWQSTLAEVGIKNSLLFSLLST